MDKIQICTIFLFQFKLGREAAETARTINEAFGPGTTNERVAQRGFKKFRNGDESLEDEDGHGQPTAVDKNLKPIPTKSHEKLLLKSRLTTQSLVFENILD